MFNITSKLEINIKPGQSLGTDMNQLPTFMIKSRIPVLICHPTILEGALIERSKTKATYKIYCSVDFEHGKRYAMDKFLDLPKAVFDSDGLEILLTANRTDMESLNEMRAIKEYINRLNSMMEIRWVLGLRTRTYESITNIMKHMIKMSASVIRTDTNVEVPAITAEDHQKDINFIKQHVATPVKISGNITLDIIKTVKNAAKFDVSVIQAKRIVKLLLAEEDEIRATKRKELEQKAEVKAPMKEIKTPTKEIKTPTKEVKTPIRETKTPVNAPFRIPSNTQNTPVKKPLLVNIQLEGKLGKEAEEKPVKRLSPLQEMQNEADAKVFASIKEEVKKTEQPREEDIIEEISDA